jgi:hypothetical protein
MANKVEIIINADGTRAIKAMQDVSATATATGKANADAAKASALAAKFEGDTISAESVKIIQAREKERLASKEYAQIQGAMRKGALDEATGVTAAAAAYQRLAASQKLVADMMRHAPPPPKPGMPTAMKTPEMYLRERLGEGMGTVGISEGMSGATAGLAAAGVAAGVLVNKLREAVGESLDLGEEMHRASQKTGIAVETLSTLKFAAKTTGGDFDSLTAAASKMGAAIGNAADGNDKKTSAFLKSLGLDAKQLANSEDGVEVALKRVAQAMAATELPARRLELARGLLGKAGQNEVAMLMDLGEHWDEYRASAERTGNMLDGKTAESLARMNQRLKELGTTGAGAGLALTEGLLPALKNLTDSLSDTGNSSAFEAMKLIGEGIGKAFEFAAARLYDTAAAATSLAAIAAGGPFSSMGRHLLEMSQGFDQRAGQMYAATFGVEIPKPVGQDAYQAGLKTGPRDYGGPKDDLLEAVRERNVRRIGAGSFDGIDSLTTKKDPNVARLKADEAELHQNQLNQPMTAKSEYNFWETKKDKYKLGSEQYNAIVAKQASLAEEGAKSAHSLIEEFKKKQLRDQVEGDRELATAMADGNRAMREMNKERYEDQRAAYAMMRDIAASSRQSELKMQELKARMYGSSEGAIARKTANLHLQEYQVASGKNADDTTSVKQDPYLTDKEKNDQLKRLGDEQLNRDRERQLQELEDQQRIQSTTLLGGMNEALRTFTLGATNAGAAAEALTSGLLNGLNKTLVEMLTTSHSQQPPHPWKSMGHDFATLATGTALSESEGKCEASISWFRSTAGLPKPVTL